MIPLLRPSLIRGRSYLWGFVDQGFSSATNFGLLLLAGRALGPSGLGVIVIGISAYLLALGFQRSLITTPLVSSSSPMHSHERLLAIRRGLTVELIGAVAATFLVFLLGRAIPGNVGRGYLIISPWLFPALVQDFWRAVLFQERRAKGAAANDASWALAMAMTAPLAWRIGTDWSVAGCWGSGALAAALLGFGQMHIRPIAAQHVLSWWRNVLWPFGRWLGVEGVVYTVTTTATVLILNGLLGTRALGGLRAAQSVFAPLSLILPAVTLPGLPATARALARSVRAAMRLSVRLSGVVTALAALYVVMMVLLGGAVIPYVFGRSFNGFKDLAVPIGVWQLATGLAAGFGIFLTAQKRGRDLLVIRATAALTSMAFVTLLAWKGGVTGAAWGFSVGGGIATTLTVAFALRSYASASGGLGPSDVSDP